MPITKTTAITQKTTTENGIILIQQTMRIIEDGALLTESLHRTSLIPGQDVATVLAADDKFSADLIPEVVAYCEREWTPELIAAYQAAQPEIAP